jgi:hypothetical protein
MAQMAGMAGAPGMMDPMMMAAAGMGGPMGHGAQVRCGCAMCCMVHVVCP